MSKKIWKLFFILCAWTLIYFVQLSLILRTNNEKRIFFEPSVNLYNFSRAVDFRFFERFDKIAAQKFHELRLANEISSLNKACDNVAVKKIFVHVLLFRTQNAPVLQSFLLEKGNYFFVQSAEVLNLPESLQRFLNRRLFVCESENGGFQVLCPFFTEESTFCCVEYVVDDNPDLAHFFESAATENFSDMTFFDARILKNRGISADEESILSQKNQILHNIFAESPHFFSALENQIALNEIAQGDIPEFLTPYSAQDFSKLLKKSPVLRLLQKTDFFVRQKWQNAISSIIWISVVFILAVASTLLLFVQVQKRHEIWAKQQEFISTVTHEMKTPIAAVSAAGQNLAKGIITAPEKIARYGIMIEDEAARLKDTVEYYLLYANISSQKSVRHVPSDIVDIVRKSTERILTEKAKIGWVYEVDLPDEEIIAACDPVAISSLVQNLVGNALKHAESGKFVRIELKKGRAPSSKILPPFFPQKMREVVFLRVIDKGEGISQEEQKMVFNPFFRGKAASEGQVEGSGIGLGLVQNIVRMHRGEIKIEKTGASGTTFLAIIPIAQGFPQSNGEKR